MVDHTPCSIVNFFIVNCSEFCMYSIVSMERSSVSARLFSCSADSDLFIIFPLILLRSITNTFYSTFPSPFSMAVLLRLLLESRQLDC